MNGADSVGKVTAVQNFGRGDILELTLRGKKGILIPFTKAAVPEVDLAAGAIRIDPLAAGLAEDEDHPHDPASQRRRAKDSGGQE
jgi:16S rRNA processing protein RimM